MGRSISISKMLASPPALTFAVAFLPIPLLASLPASSVNPPSIMGSGLGGFLLLPCQLLPCYCHSTVLLVWGFLLLSCKLLPCYCHLTVLLV